MCRQLLGKEKLSSWSQSDNKETGILLSHARTFWAKFHAECHLHFDQVWIR